MIIDTAESSLLGMALTDSGEVIGSNASVRLRLTPAP
jgi:hypothetical protein